MEKVYRAESYGEGGHKEVEVHMDIGRKVSQEECYIIGRAMEDVLNEIQANTNKMDVKRQDGIKKENKEIISLFDGQQIFVEEIPNGYCNRHCCRDKPWFVVTTKVGRIKIGWRKSVINIDWNDSAIKETAEKLFPGEDVTKIDKSIHAWGYDKAREYLKKIME